MRSTPSLRLAISTLKNGLAIALAQNATVCKPSVSRLDASLDVKLAHRRLTNHWFEFLCRVFAFRCRDLRRAACNGSVFSGAVILAVMFSENGGIGRARRIRVGGDVALPVTFPDLPPQFLKMAERYPECISLSDIYRRRAIFTQHHAPFTPHRQIRQVRARYGGVAYFDRSVGFLTRPDAIQEILDVRFDRNPAPVFVDRLRGFVRTGPRFGINTIAVVIKFHRRLASLQNYLPAVVIRIAVTQGPGRHIRRVYV